MKLISYKYSDPGKNPWSISEFTLGNINLIAGLSAVGKTRILNTIYNLSQMIQKMRIISDGIWDFTFKIGNHKYRYQLVIEKDAPKDSSSDKSLVKKEILLRDKTKIIERSPKSFKFRNKTIPTLSREDIGIYLLREDKTIKKVFDAFGKIFIRRLNPPYAGSGESRPGLMSLSNDFLQKPEKDITLAYIQREFKEPNTQMFVLKRFHPDIFSNIVNDFKSIFPFVVDVDTVPIEKVKSLIFSAPLASTEIVPVLCISEKGVEEKIPIMSMSSGMIRSIIQLIDIYTMPNQSVYLIDELENSMGINALPQMIDILLNHSNSKQLIFTTHLPYVFNNVPVKYWKILKRKGGKVDVITGEELEKKYAMSYQDAYTQLINSALIEDGIA